MSRRAELTSNEALEIAFAKAQRYAGKRDAEHLAILQSKCHQIALDACRQHELAGVLRAATER